MLIELRFRIAMPLGDDPRYDLPHVSIAHDDDRISDDEKQDEAKTSSHDCIGRRRELIASRNFQNDDTNGDRWQDTH